MECQFSSNWIKWPYKPPSVSCIWHSSETLSTLEDEGMMFLSVSRHTTNLATQNHSPGDLNPQTRITFVRPVNPQIHNSQCKLYYMQIIFILIHFKQNTTKRCCYYLLPSDSWNRGANSSCIKNHWFSFFHMNCSKTFHKLRCHHLFFLNHIQITLQ